MATGKTILITGGTGYVGSRVAEALNKAGEKVLVVDIATPEERGITFSPGIEFRRHDLRIPGEALKGLAGADLVLHLAADIGSLTYMHDHQAEILTNNSAIDAAVYPALVANKIPWVIYSSSSAVFQYPPQFPYTEKDIRDIRPPSNVYGFAKLGGEYFCRSYAAQFGLEYTIIRYHNIYGPGEDSKGSTPGDIHVIPALLQKVLGGQYPLEFLGNPEATRPFVYIDDAVEATVAVVMRAARAEDMVKNEDFNIGNDTHYTILELGKRIWEKYGGDRPFKYAVVDTQADTALRREVDIAKIREKLGWSPKVGLEEGLEPVAKWIRERGTRKRSLWQ
ncbi:MAG TPA: NAD-dependent epimerase/dehydratase family protein [Candidatus Paceibacterota bacterium]|nr:NAD-dependent epimerase/dehydratase family protein [Candidatus Paceibacterota bacterium]